MQYLPNILFVVALVLGIGYFTKNIRKVIRNIKLGRAQDHSDHPTGSTSSTTRLTNHHSNTKAKIVSSPADGLEEVHE